MTPLYPSARTDVLGCVIRCPASEKGSKKNVAPDWPTIVHIDGVDNPHLEPDFLRLCRCQVGTGGAKATPIYGRAVAVAN